MNSFRTKYLLVAFGRGGHQEEMRRVLKCLSEDVNKDVKLIVLTDSEKKIKTSFDIEKTYVFSEARDKHSNIHTLINMPKLAVKQMVVMFSIIFNYRFNTIVVTGPGVALIPAVICKLFGKKLVVFESWCRFYQKSWTGKLLYPISNLFFVQNLSMKKLYRKAIYKGRL